MQRDYGFQSGSPQSVVLFPETINNDIWKGIPLPHNFSKFSISAQSMYVHAYTQAQLLGCTPRKCHTAAFEQVKKTHILRNGQWILPDPSW